MGESRCLTNWNHALRIIIQILQHLFDERKHPRGGTLVAQKATLLLERLEQLRHLPDDALVRAVLDRLVEHDGKVEDELVARVLAVLDAHRVAQDPVLVRAHRDEAVAEVLLGDDVLGHRVEVEEGR